MRRVLVVGQIPPPHGGQAMMIKYMIESEMTDVVLYHVRMNFSKDFNQRGKFNLGKVIHLFSVIYQAVYYSFRYKIDVLYYPLSNSPKVSIIRDFIILIFIRSFFRKTIYHFHAAGISEELPYFPSVMKRIVYKAISKPDLTITSSIFNPKDGEYLKSKKDVVIPLGIPDLNTNSEYFKPVSKRLSILFMGLLNKSKGELYIIEALKLLKLEGVILEVCLAGRFESDQYRSEFFNLIREYELESQVKYLGVITGEEKLNAFKSADIFCFPSYFPSESFGIVLLEAMQFHLPIIATRWRGIQSIVKNGENGFLVETHNAEQIRDMLLTFVNNPQLLKEMGDAGRKEFEDKYQLDNYISKLNDEFFNV